MPLDNTPQHPTTTAPPTPLSPTPLALPSPAKPDALGERRELSQSTKSWQNPFKCQRRNDGSPTPTTRRTPQSPQTVSNPALHEAQGSSPESLAKRSWMVTYSPIAAAHAVAPPQRVPTNPAVVEPTTLSTMAATATDVAVLATTTYAGGVAGGAIGEELAREYIGELAAPFGKHVGKLAGAAVAGGDSQNCCQLSHTHPTRQPSNTQTTYTTT